jgi:hypothetical protein
MNIPGRKSPEPGQILAAALKKRYPALTDNDAARLGRLIMGKVAEAIGGGKRVVFLPNELRDLAPEAQAIGRRELGRILAGDDIMNTAFEFLDRHPKK